MKDMGEKLGRTLAIAFLVGAGSVISAVSAVPDCLQAAEAASAVAERQEHIQEVAGNALVTVRQHNVALRDYQGRELHTGKYLELAAKPGASHALRRSLARWNDAECTRWAGDEKMLRNAVHFTEENGIPMYAPYYMGHAIAGWGRVDDAVLSFCTRTESYTGGAHPNHAYQSWNLDLRTGEPIALRDIVTSRRAFLTAVAAAFRAQYPGREDETFRRTIDAQLESIYPYLDWDQSTVWIMLPGGGIRVYYSAYELAPYAAGDFILTLMPEGNPGLFKAR